MSQKETRAQVATAVNAGLTLLYWRIGKRINEEILNRNRAEYDAQIVSALRRQLSWTHFKSIIYLDDSLKRDFYAEMCRVEGWSTRTLQKKIGSMLYERTALSRKPEELARIELDALREEDLLRKPGTLPLFSFRTPRFLWFEYLIQPKFQQVNEGFRSKGPSGVRDFTDCAIGFFIFNENTGSVPGFPGFPRPKEYQWLPLSAWYTPTIIFTMIWLGVVFGPKTFAPFIYARF